MVMILVRAVGMILNDWAGITAGKMSFRERNAFMGNMHPVNWMWGLTLGGRKCFSNVVLKEIIDVAA